jgi:hypothetical protein
MNFKGVLLFLGAFIVWFTLNRWVLPWCGVPTCMSGRCTSEPCPACGASTVNSGQEDPGPLQRHQ